MLRRDEPDPPDKPAVRLVTLDEVGLQNETGDETLLTTEVRDLEHEKTALELSDYAANIEHRRTYAGKIFRFVSIWMLGVFGTILADGLGLVEISDKVLITLISGTTVNVLGIFAIVANYFFPKK